MLKIIPRFRPYNFVSLKDAFFYMFNDDESITKFEEQFAKYIHVDHAVAMPSATIGIFSVLNALEVKKSEIIIPAYTFWAVPNMAILAGLNPVFVDIDDYYTLNPNQVRASISRKTKVILPTHMFGQPCDMGSLMDLVGKRDITVVEDCAPACGAEYQSKKVGSIGDFGIFSFNKFKNLTTFGGGMVVTNNERIAKKIRGSLSALGDFKKSDLFKTFFINFAMKYCTKPCFFGSCVYPLVYPLNFLKIDLLDKIFREKIELLKELPSQPKFSGFHAKIGLKHLNMIEEVNEKRIENCHFFSKILSQSQDINLPKERKDSKHIYLNYIIKIIDKYKVADRLLSKSVDIRKNVVQVCSDLSMFRGYKKKCPQARDLYNHMLDLPISSYLTEKDVCCIADALLESLK